MISVETVPFYYVYGTPKICIKEIISQVLNTVNSNVSSGEYTCERNYMQYCRSMLRLRKGCHLSVKELGFPAVDPLQGASGLNVIFQTCRTSSPRFADSIG